MALLERVRLRQERLREAAAGWEPAGRTAALGLLGGSLLMLALSFARADPAPVWQGLRLDSWAAVGFAVMGVVWIAHIWIKDVQGLGDKG
jgi:hypothetical protein